MNLGHLDLENVQGNKLFFLILKRIHVFLGSAGGRETVNASMLGCCWNETIKEMNVDQLTLKRSNNTGHFANRKSEKTYSNWCAMNKEW